MILQPATRGSFSCFGFTSHSGVSHSSGVTYSHVRPAACIPGFGDGVHQLAADAEVAQLNVAVPVEEDV